MTPPRQPEAKGRKSPIAEVAAEPFRRRRLRSSKWRDAGAPDTARTNAPSVPVHTLPRKAREQGFGPAGLGLLPGRLSSAVAARKQPRAPGKRWGSAQGALVHPWLRAPLGSSRALPPTAALPAPSQQVAPGYCRQVRCSPGGRRWAGPGWRGHPTQGPACDQTQHVSGGGPPQALPLGWP